MVNETTELQVEAGLEDEFVADDAIVTDDPSEDSLDAEPSTEQQDQFEAVVAATRSEIETLRAQVQSEMGRAQRLERLFEEFRKAPKSEASPELLSEIESRLEQYEDFSLVTAEGLIANEYTDEAARARLIAARSNLSGAKSERERKRMRSELRAEVMAAIPQAQQAEPADESPTQARSPEAQSATAQVFGYAEAKGVNPDAIPETAWALQPGETLALATQRVKGIVDGLAAGGLAANRTASRRQAAGNGSPSRSAGTPSISTMSEAEDAYNAGSITHEAFKEYRARFGVSAVPGGGR